MAFRHYTIGGIPVIQSSYLARVGSNQEPEMDIPGMLKQFEFLDVQFPNDRENWGLFDSQTVQTERRKDGFDYFENHELRIRRSSILEIQIEGLTQPEVFFHYMNVSALVMSIWPPITGSHGTEELDNESSLITRFYHANIRAVKRKFESPMVEMIRAGKQIQRL